MKSASQQTSINSFTNPPIYSYTAHSSLLTAHYSLNTFSITIEKFLQSILKL